MGKMRFRWVGLLVSVAIVAGAATAFGDLGSDFSSPAAPVPGTKSSPEIYLQMTGSSGKFQGGVGVAGYAGDIQVLALDLPSTPTGQAPCSSIEFRKVTDQSTPALFLAERQNETVTSAVFNEVNYATRGPRLVLKVTAFNATISSIHHVDSTTTGAYDDVTLTPTKMSIEWVASKHAVLYTCNPT